MLVTNDASVDLEGFLYGDAGVGLLPSVLGRSADSRENRYELSRDTKVSSRKKRVVDGSVSRTK